MPIKAFGKTYKHFAAAEKAAARKKGIEDPGAYIASLARAQGEIPGKRKKRKK